ncbi:MAG: NUDIX domain-containing protein [Caulobacter sp.]|nr:NUDIX domain-containing protein [Caulobacter sp.]
MTEKAPAAIRSAATILLVRDDPGFEVLMVKRHHQIDFASGALVFPGGKTHGGDHDPAWVDHCLGWADIEEGQRPLRIAAVREAYEETGIILGRHPDGRSFSGDERAARSRGEVDRQERSFLSLVVELGIVLDIAALTVFARWITPSMMPKRFDTWFYVAKADGDQIAACDGRETVDAEWIHPHEALRLAETGERTIIFPTRMNLQLLGESGCGDEAVAKAGARPLVTVEPMVEQRPAGGVLTIPIDAGYGAVEEPLSNIR